MTKILNKCATFSEENIAIIEKAYKAKYVFESSIRRDEKLSWSDIPVAIFYTEKKHPEGSNYFGIWREPSSAVYIADAISAANEEIIGVVADNGDVIYSRYRHDFRTSPDGSVWIDGGRDYVRVGGNNDFVTMKVVDGVLTIINSTAKEAEKI